MLPPAMVEKVEGLDRYRVKEPDLEAMNLGARTVSPQAASILRHLTVPIAKEFLTSAFENGKGQSDELIRSVGLHITERMNTQKLSYAVKPFGQPAPSSLPMICPAPECGTGYPTMALTRCCVCRRDVTPVPKRGLRLESFGPIYQDGTTWDAPYAYKAFEQFSGEDFSFGASESMDVLDRGMPKLPPVSQEECHKLAAAGILFASDLPASCRSPPDNQKVEEAALVHPARKVLDEVHKVYKEVCKEADRDARAAAPKPSEASQETFVPHALEPACMAAAALSSLMHC